MNHSSDEECYAQLEVTSHFNERNIGCSETLASELDLSSNHQILPYKKKVQENVTDDGEVPTKENYLSQRIDLPAYVRALSLIVAIVFLACVIFGICIFMNRQGIALRKVEVDESKTVTVTITSAEVALHNTEDDLWVIVHGIVYDLTNYKHSGEIGRAHV